jgi:hypothetical protein
VKLQHRIMQNLQHEISWTRECRAFFFLLAVVLLFNPLFTGAQELTATLSGVVSDATGALVPHASITIAQNGVNGVTRVVQSDNTGNYVATNLIAGTYSITVTAPGFETFMAKDIVLNVAEKHAVNAQLKAGSVNTTITVEDNPVSIDTESSAQAGTITGTQVRELEISNRNFAMLVTLQPGVINAGLGDEATTESNTGLAVNGARSTANNWTVDGADINDSGSNQTTVNAPSIDAIQEFTLQRGSYDAGYGRSGGAQILVQTKQGSSTFHGDAYEFVRNTDFNANEWFNKAGGMPRADYHRNDFGYTVGGPIYIPHVYNSDKKKTFFFWSQEWQKQVQPSSGVNAAPSTADTQGFIADTQSGSTYYPYVPSLSTACTTIFHNGTTAAVLDGTVSVPAHSTYIPTSCWSKNAKVYNTDVFIPNVAAAGTSNSPYAFSAPSNYRQEILRIDHNFSDKLHFFARGIEEKMPYLNVLGLWSGTYPGLSEETVDSPGKNVVGNLTWTISPKMINEFEFVWAQGTYSAIPIPGEFFNSSTAFSTLTDNWAYADPYGRNPNLSVTGVGGYAAGNAPYGERNLDRTYFDNLAITLGKHTIRTGFQIQQMIKTENGTSGNAGFTFTNTQANSSATWSYGDFLLGQVNTYSQINRDTVPDLRFVNAEAYVQDDWKISHKLTVNLGLRWSRFPSPSDVNGTLVNFDPLVYNAANAPAITAAGNFPSGNPNTYGNGIIAPKGGTCEAAQYIAPLTTCSPFGSQVNPAYNGDFGPRVGFAYNPDGHGKTSIRGGFGIFYDRVLDGIWEDNAFHDQPLAQTTTINNGSFDNIMGTGLAAPPGLAPNGMITTGTPAFKPPNYANYNLSAQRQLLPTTTVEVAYVGNVARHLIGQIDLNQPTMAARNAHLTDDVNAIRPYLGFGHLETVAAIYTNNYNALQVSANHKAHGLTLGVAYTWSKDLTTNPFDRQCCETSNTYNVKMDYGPSTITNTPQVAEISYVYDLPFMKAQKGILGRVMGGWEVSGITSFISGTSATVNQNEDPFNSIAGNRGLGLAQQNGPGWWTSQSTRPNQVSAIQKTKKLGEWFSTSSFAVASGNWGTEKNGALLGPGVQRWDMAAIKNVNLVGPVKFQLRGEFFNAFNHENFSGIGTGIDAGTPATGGSFGTITSGHSPRVIQIAGKLIF